MNGHESKGETAFLMALTLDLSSGGGLVRMPRFLLAGVLGLGCPRETSHDVPTIYRGEKPNRAVFLEDFLKIFHTNLHQQARIGESTFSLADLWTDLFCVGL